MSEAPKSARASALQRRMTARKASGSKVSTVETGNIEQALSVVDQLDRSPSVFLDVDVRRIAKLQNPREVPCSLDEMKAIEWPGLDTPAEAIEQAHMDCLNKAALPFWKKASPELKGQILSFFEDIHTLAISMIENSQIQNIVTQRKSRDAIDFDLIAGERRLFAALYTRGQIKTLQSKVFNKALSALEVAKLTDQENTGKPLTPYEKLMSKLAVFDAAEGAASMTTAALQKLLGSAMGEVSLIRRVATAEKRAEMLAFFKANKSGWREVRAVVESGVIPKPGEATKSQEPEQSQLSTVETPSAAESKAAKESAPNPLAKKLKRAGSFGLQLKNRTNLGVTQLLLANLRRSKDLKASLREQIEGVDLEDPEGILEAWCILADHIEAQHQ